MGGFPGSFLLPQVPAQGLAQSWHHNLCVEVAEIKGMWGCVYARMDLQPKLEEWAGPWKGPDYSYTFRQPPPCTGYSGPQ